MELVLLVFFIHPPACDEAARRFHFYRRLATTFALRRSRAISESKDHKKWVGIFLETSKPNPDPEPGTSCLEPGQTGAPAIAGECSGTASTISTKVKESESEAVKMH